MRTILAFPGDEHAGSTVGLIRSKQWELTSGGYHNPSRGQIALWKQYEECWNRIRDLRKEKKSRVIITEMSDPVDGDHHDSIELITKSTEEQERIFIDCLDNALEIIKFDKRRGDILQFLSGTPAHTRNGQQSIERIARDMDARPYKANSEFGVNDGKYTFDRLEFSVKGNVFDCAHKGFSVGKKQWTKTNSIKSVLADVYYSCLEYKKQIPRYIIRAHFHEFTTTDFRGNHGTIEGIVTPSFSLLTEYSKMIISSKLNMASVGMLIVVVEDDGSTWWECPMMTVTSKNNVEEL